MFLKKICLFLIVAFLCVDAFLLSLYIQANRNLNELSENLVDNTVKYYNSIGIEINEKVIERDVPDNKIYTFSSDNSTIGMETAEKLAENMFSAETSVNIVETPEGPSYTIIENGTTVASFRVYSDSFGFEYVSDGFSAENSGLSDKPFSNSNTDIEAENKKALEQFVTAISKSTKPLYEIKGSYKTVYKDSICIEFLIDDKCNIDGMFMNVVAENGKILYAKGNIILAEIIKSYSEMLYDGVNALNKVDSTLVSKFVSEKIVYTAKYAGNGIYYLLPVWKIEYVDIGGKSQIQYIDAIKG